jgi:hypothetical protein
MVFYISKRVHLEKLFRFLHFEILDSETNQTSIKSFLQK